MDVSCLIRFDQIQLKFILYLPKYWSFIFLWNVSVWLIWIDIDFWEKSSSNAVSMHKRIHLAQQPHLKDFLPGLMSHCLGKEIYFFFKVKVVLCDHFKSLTLSKPYSKRIGILYFPINNTFSLLRSCENVRTHGVV